MSRNCLDIGTLQAFLDGETKGEETILISNHISDCDTCALMLAEAEEEMSFVMATVESDVNMLVPTQRLWSRINDAIETERAHVPFWHRMYVGFTSMLASPSLATAAAVLVLFGFFAFIFIPGGGLNDATNEIVRVSQPAATVSVEAEPLPTVRSAPPVNTEVAEAELEAVPVRTEQPKASPARATHAAYRPDNVARPPAGNFRPVNALYVPGEDSYLNTIETLKASYDSQKDRVLSPSSRVSFERDLAVVENSIKQMREVVRKNPNNQAARQVLYSSYQDKIDLLNSVGQKEELLASLQ
ncbi:MAG: hypothetical protein IPM21_09265 [Acidobacteria bacterium]|nr:hypothetical protein [Acidobacteriota bacterium]